MDFESATPLVTWMGDDFTGSAAVTEVLQFAGLPSVLFTDIPSPALAARFAHCKGIGIATTARSLAPDQMQQTLPPLFDWLHRLDAPILHYKLCSTFDSSPTTGSIGAAIDIGLRTRPAQAVPLLTAAPQMRRYQAFGHLFAGALDGTYRLDRHPVMQHHPVTPMTEADLRRHLAQQTDLPSALIDLEALAGDPTAALNAALAEGACILSIDSMDATSETKAGQLIWENRDRLGFVAGSQGVEYALVRHWVATGLIEPATPPAATTKCRQIVAVSGSVSPVTARQLAWAGQNGFTLLAFDARAVFGDQDVMTAQEARLIDAAKSVAAAGQSPLIHSAAGHDGPEVAAFRRTLETAQIDPGVANQRIGESLGRILDATLQATGLSRAVISGGDTSGHGMRQLGLSALVAKAPTIPGAALCQAFGDSPHDGLEIALKGGQMGSEDYFGWIRDGGGIR